VRCRWWDIGRCRCDGAVNCLHIGFTIRGEEEGTIKPTNAEKAMAKAQIPSEDFAQKENEPFIVWKVRVAGKIYNLAMNIHNQPEDGMVYYKYENWRRESELDRRTNFMRTIRDVRGLNPADGSNLANAVGCLACGKIFLNTDFLNAHVDLHRYRGEADHYTTQMVSTTEVTPIRPLSITYRPPPTHIVQPTPTPRPSRPTQHRRPIRLERYEREPDESYEHYEENLTVYVNDIREGNGGQYQDAIGCTICGNIYTNVSDFMTHAIDEHSLPITETEEHGVPH